jgi:hypothetical protein
MIEHTGNFRLRAWLRHDQVGLEVLPAGRYIEVGKHERGIGRIGQRGCVAPLSCQVWKCMVSVGPMLSGIRKTCGWVTLWAKVG